MKHYKKKITYKLLFLDFKSVVFLGVIHVGFKSLIQRPGLLRDLTTHQEQGSWDTCAKVLSGQVELETSYLEQKVLIKKKKVLEISILFN